MSFLPTSSPNVALVMFFAFFINIIIVDFAYATYYYGHKESGAPIAFANTALNIFLKHLIPVIFVIMFFVSTTPQTGDNIAM